MTEDTSLVGTVEEGLHAFRKEIDANIKVAEQYLIDEPLSHRREMEKVRTKLQEAKMWAGKCLEVVGAPFPKELRDEACSCGENETCSNCPSKK